MITPMDSRILVEIPKVNKTTAGGIILPDDVTEREEMAQVRAVVVSIGEWAFPDLTFAPKIGDTVYISKYAGLFYEENGKEYRILDTTNGASDVVAYDSEYEGQDMRNFRNE